MVDAAEEFVFFWKPEQPYGWASQWHHSPFAAPITLPDGEQRDIVFPTAEHWMMGQKALLFGVKGIFERIVGHSSSSATANSGPGPTRTTRSRASKSQQTNAKAVRRAPGPKEVKALGRKVKNFNEETWVRERERIVLEGSLLKLWQHEGLRKELLQTGEKKLVEASPLDRVWGIGLGAAKAAETCGSEESQRNTGWGLNLLGKALMEARRILREEPGGTGVDPDTQLGSST